MLLWTIAVYFGFSVLTARAWLMCLSIMEGSNCQCWFPWNYVNFFPVDGCVSTWYSTLQNPRAGPSVPNRWVKSAPFREAYQVNRSLKGSETEFSLADRLLVHIGLCKTCHCVKRGPPEGFEIQSPKIAEDCVCVCVCLCTRMYFCTYLSYSRESAFRVLYWLQNCSAPQALGAV